MGLHPENQANGRWRRSARASFRLSVLTLRLVSGFAVKLSVLQKTKGGSMRSYSMDSETSAPKDTGRIGNIAKANGRNESQPQSPPPCSGGAQP